jgi:hypothetical protein
LTGSVDVRDLDQCIRDGFVRAVENASGDLDMRTGGVSLGKHRRKQARERIAGLLRRQAIGEERPDRLR